MSVAWFIVLEQKIPGFDPFVNGKALARFADKLDLAVRAKGLLPLMSFFSTSPDEIAALAAEHGVDVETPQAEVWYSAEDGLRTVNFMLEELQKDASATAATKDLFEFRDVLETAHKHAVRWHLAIDF